MAGNIKGITIEIGGDTTKLDKALKDVNKTSRDLNKELRSVNTSLKFNPGNAELIAQKQRILAESVDNTKNKLETLKVAQEQAAQALARGEIGQDEYDALTREIIKTENQLKSLQGELDKTNNKWQEVGDKLKSTGDSMVKVGEGMTKGVTAPILAVGGLAIAAFKEVDDGLDTVVSKTGATGEALESLEQSFKNVAGSMPASFDEVGNAIGEVNTQFGLMGEELEAASEKIIKFAQINGTDVTNSVINAKQAIDKYNLSAEDLDMVLDAVTKTAQNTGVDVDKLFDIMIKGSPQINQLGLDFAQATEMMGRMEQKGIDSNKALSYLTRAQTNWAKEGKSMIDGLQELEERLASATTHEEKLAIAAEEFGTKGGAYMLEVLESGALNADDFANAMEEAAGSVDSTWEGMLDPIDLVKQAMNNLKISGADLGTSIQEVLLPVLEGAIGAFQKFADWFGKLDPQVREMGVKFALVAAAIGPLLIVIGKIVGAIGSLVTFFGAGGAAATLFSGAIAFITGPIGIAIGVITALIAIGTLLYQNWETIQEYATEIWGSIVEFLSSIWESITETWSQTWENIKTTLSNVWQGFKDIASTAFEAVKTTISTVWEGIKSTTQSVWEGIKSVVEGIWNGIKSVAETVFNAVKTKVEEVWNAIKTKTEEIWNGIKTFVETAWNGIKTKATEVFDAIKNKIQEIWTAVKSKTEEVWNGIKTSIENIWNNLKTFAETTFDGIKTKVSDVWDNIKSKTEQVWEAVKKAIENPINKARDAVNTAIEKIKSILSIELPFPKIKLPHFRISGSFSLNPPSVPSFGVDWYDKGGIFKSPTVIGVGEKRPEIVGALEDFKDIVDRSNREHSGNKKGDVIITGNTFVVRQESDIKKVAEELNKLQERTNRGRGVVTA